MEEEVHQFPDGSFHSFPKGTSNDVIKKAIKEHMQSPPTGTRDVVNSVTPNAVKKVIAQIDPVTVISGEAGALATVGSSLIPGIDAASPIIGSATMSAVDNFLRHYTGENQESDTLTNIADITKDAAMNELMGHIFSGLVKGGSAIKKGIQEKIIPGTVVKDTTGVLQLKPTFSQLLRAQGSKFSGMVGSFEDLFSPSTKMEALQNSFNAAKDEGDKFLESLTGRTNKAGKNISKISVDLNEPNKFASLIKEGSEKTFLDLKTASNARGEAAKLIAESNVTSLPIMQAKQTGIDAAGKPIISMVQVGTKEIKGPVDYENTILMAKRLKDEMFSASIKPDPESPVLKALNDILDATNAKFDKAGNLVSHDPVSFGQAWKDKQISDAIGYGTPLTDLKLQDVRFKQISNSLNKDIDNSLPRWTNNGDKAQLLWNESKEIVAKRNTLFNPSDETGKGLDTLLNTVTGSNSTINTVLDDPKKLQNFLETGRISIPDAYKVNAKGIPSKSKITYISSNARKDAQGYTLQRFLNEATVPDSKDVTKNVFDATKLQSLINDPNRQESLTKIFGSQNLSNVQQFFKNIAFTTEKGTSLGASRYLSLRIGAYGVTLGTGIASALSSGVLSPVTATAGVATGLVLGAHQLAKAMTNPESARIMLAMAQGTPLKMSVQAATRIIANSLRNMPVKIEYQDGNQLDGKIDNMGKFGIPLSGNMGKDLSQIKYEGAK